MRSALVNDCLFTMSMLLGVFGKVRQGRPRLLTRGLVEEAPQGVVNRPGPTAAGLDVGGNRIEILVVVTRFFLVSGVFISKEPWPGLRQPERGPRRGRRGVLESPLRSCFGGFCSGGIFGARGRRVSRPSLIILGLGVGTRGAVGRSHTWGSVVRALEAE